MFVDLYSRYGRVFRESQRLPLAWHRLLWEPLNEHENIIRAVEARDPDNAAYFMRVHLVRGADRIGIALTDNV
jgi:GntR family transcriptional repressor for pyruvate dehydrogenase complex